MSEQKPEITDPSQPVVGKFSFPIGVDKNATNSFKDYVYSGLDDMFLKLNPEYANKAQVKDFSIGRVRLDDLLKESREEFYKLPLPRDRIDLATKKKPLKEYLDSLKASGQNECVNCGYALKTEEKSEKYCPSCGSLMVYSQSFLTQLERRLKEYERVEESLKRGSEANIASTVNKFVNQEWPYYRDCFRDHPDLKKETIKILKLDQLLQNNHALKIDLVDSFRDDISSYFNDNFHKIFKFKILRYSSELKKRLPFSFSRDELTGRVNEEFFYPLFDNLRALFIKPSVDSYYLKRTLTSETRKETKPESSQLKHFRADFVCVIVPLIAFIAICSVFATYYAFSRIFYSISAKEVMPLIISVWTVFWSLVLLKVYFSLRK